MKLNAREIAQDLQASEEEIIQEGLEAFLRKKLRFHRMEYRTICERYRVKSLEEMDRLIREGLVEEEEILEDFQRADYLALLIEKIEKRLA
jgi:hypothetical protein